MAKGTSINILIFLVFFFSPLYVDYYWKWFTVAGWAGIGEYNNNLFEGYYRSFFYSIYFVPLFYFLIKFSKPIFGNKLSLIKNKSIYMVILSIFILFFIVAYNFRLGITGVETPTEWHLSGIVHYFRSYLAPIILIGYLSTYKPSLNFIFFYSLVAGISASSRFSAVTPLALYFIFSYVNKTIISKRVIVVFYILFLFILITLLRSYIYSDNPNMNDIQFDFESISRIIGQILLRVGVGRDVILSSEILNSGVCSEYLKFFLSGNSCNNPAFDFYGLQQSSSRFGLSSPTLASFYVISKDLDQFLLYILFIFQIYIGSKLILLISKFGNIFVIYSIFAWFMSLVFIVIGPLLFFNYLVLLNVVLVLIFYFIRSAVFVTKKISI
jgi:hypothetical protein